MWEHIKTPIIIIGIILFIVIVIFLYLLIAGADESRRRDRAPRCEKSEMER